MRAARLVEIGRPLQIEQVDEPEPGPGEVIVDMAYAGVNPVDRYQAEGRVNPDGPRPRTLGSEGAGWFAGRAWLVRGHGLGTTRDGLWAEKAAVPEAALVALPDGADLRQAASMGVAGVTAWRCAFEKASVGAEDRVLVLGASGGVGSILVPLAASTGAEVWGHTASPAKADWVRRRGAAEVVVGDAAAVADTAARFAPTVAFDPLGGAFFGAAVSVLSPRGRLVPFGTSAGPSGEVPLQVLYRKALTVSGYSGLIESDEAIETAIREALAAWQEGRFDIPIDRAIPLDCAPDAFSLLVDRSVRGKVVLDLRRPAAA